MLGRSGDLCHFLFNPKAVMPLIVTRLLDLPVLRNELRDSHPPLAKQGNGLPSLRHIGLIDQDAERAPLTL